MTAPTMILQHSGWKHLWLKYVQDVDLTRHCTRCLVGAYDRRISPRTPHERPIDLDKAAAPLGYYLCGVSPAGYAYNLHLAFTAGPGQVTRRIINGPSLLTVTIYGATEVKIGPAPYERTTGDMRFDTCRCWQHAVALQEATVDRGMSMARTATA